MGRGFRFPSPSRRHQNAVYRKARELSREGYRVFFLKRIPDAIAVKDNEVYAVEAIPEKYSANTERKKRQFYSAFDSVIFVTYPNAAKKVTG